MSTLKINFTDNTIDGKASIMLSPNTINNSTSLTLHGQGSSNYGADLWSNMLKMMEHFCSYSEPVSPTEGQLWYNPIEKCLQIYSTDANGVLCWFKIFVDNPDGNGPSFKVDDLTGKLLEDYVKRSGDSIVGWLNLPQEPSKTDSAGKSWLLPTAKINELNAASRFYVDTKINEQFDLRVQTSESNTTNDFYYTTVGDTFIFHGIIPSDKITKESLKSRTDNEYGVKFTYKLNFPNIGDIYPPDALEKPKSTFAKLDINKRPQYEVHAHADLGHANTTIDEYFKNDYPDYPVQIKNKTDKSLEFECCVGQLVDPAYYDVGELRSYRNTTILDINSQTTIRSIKFIITGRLA
jgi:hypothetical protein